MAEKSDTVQIVMFISAVVNDRRNGKPLFLLMLTSLDIAFINMVIHLKQNINYALVSSYVRMSRLHVKCSVLK